MQLAASGEYRYLVSMIDAWELVSTGSWVNVDQIAFPSGCAPERFRLQCAASRLEPLRLFLRVSDCLSSITKYVFPSSVTPL